MAKTLFGEQVISHRENKHTQRHWLTIHTPVIPNAGLLCTFEEAGWDLAFAPIARMRGDHALGYSLTFKSAGANPDLPFEEVLPV